MVLIAITSDKSFKSLKDIFEILFVLFLKLKVQSLYKSFTPFKLHANKTILSSILLKCLAFSTSSTTLSSKPYIIFLLVVSIDFNCILLVWIRDDNP